MAQRATSLGPKPSLLFVFVFLLFFVVCFFWRVEGSGEVAQRATSLGPKPSLFSFCFFCFCFSLCFPFFVFNRQKTCFPPKKGHFLFIFQCLPLFLFSLFGASPLNFLFSFFVSLSLSLVIFFFLPSCFSFSLSGSCFFPFVVFAFFVSRCSVVFVVLLVVLCCFES